MTLARRTALTLVNSKSNQGTGRAEIMIYATASTWAQDIKQRLRNTPFNIGPAADLIGLGGFACFAAAGLMLWMDQTRSAFAALSSVLIFMVGLIMFGTSIVLRAGMPQQARQVSAAKPGALSHHPAE
ncbi:hypothetical protein JL101_006990 [Skermanella rosea]|uniref:hypothetical protein n=1 Tax=Skermanella rosea TaxID=1817965 RepID=UPI0019312231|nr:hypothetical protein [Skermanella rosea]UEM05175.1 hypothetical protein JL101_006990 [Skermanella rosea]